MFSTSSAFPVTNYTIRNILVINNLRVTWHLNFDIAFILNIHVNYAFYNIIALFSNMLKKLCPSAISELTFSSKYSFVLLQYLYLA